MSTNQALKWNKPMIADLPIDPPDDAARPDPMASMMPLPEALRVVQGVMARLVAKQATQLAESLGPDQSGTVFSKLAATSALLADHNARGSGWLDTKAAAYRSTCSGGRMYQLRESGDLVTRRRGGGPIFYSKDSVDARLRSLNREPRLTREEQAAEAKAKTARESSTDSE